MPQQSHKPWINYPRRALCQLQFSETFVMLGHGSKLHFMEHMKWFTQWIGWIIYNMNYWPGLTRPVLNSCSFFVPFLFPCGCPPLHSSCTLFIVPLAGRAQQQQQQQSLWRHGMIHHTIYMRQINTARTVPYYEFPFLCLAHLHYNIC